MLTKPAANQLHIDQIPAEHTREKMTEHIWLINVREQKALESSVNLTSFVTPSDIKDGYVVSEDC